MHERTIKVLKRLEGCDWFSNVGTNNGIPEGSIVALLSSWNEAIESCSSLEWDNLCLEAANQYRQRIGEQAPDRLRDWNNKIMSVRPIADRLASKIIEEYCVDSDIREVLVNTLRWDIVHICLEYEYADIYPPGYYASQAFWYSTGHFPCGWSGAFPEGNLIIY